MHLQFKEHPILIRQIAVGLLASLSRAVAGPFSAVVQRVSVPVGQLTCHLFRLWVPPECQHVPLSRAGSVRSRFLSEGQLAAGVIYTRAEQPTCLAVLDWR